jgi:serine/threonine protein kinase
MTISTSEEFLDALEKANLVESDQLAAARRQAADALDLRALCKALIQQNILTAWQVGQLLVGRASFYVGQYKLIDLLGSGGMGHVFLACHTMMNRTVALKRMSKQLSNDPASRDRFLTEARAVAALDHPNIIRAYSVDYDDGRYYMVMEYVEGTDLQKMVAQQGPLGFEDAVGYIRQAADGLAHAHQRGLIHCDIKPSNLLVNLQGVIKILDLGLSRFRDDSSSPDDSTYRGTDQLVGTVDYMAPEQALGSPDLDHRADIYSLGCTLYFLLCGHAPFPHGTLHEKLLRHQTQMPASLLDERPGMPRDLAEFCERMMAKEPGQRIQTADEVSRFLADWELPQQRLRKAVPLSEQDLQSLAAKQADSQPNAAAQSAAPAVRSLFDDELAAMAGPASPQPTLPSPLAAPSTVKKPPQSSDWPRIVAVSTLVAAALIVVLLVVVTMARNRQHARQQPSQPVAPSMKVDVPAATKPSPSTPPQDSAKKESAKPAVSPAASKPAPSEPTKPPDVNLSKAKPATTPSEPRKPAKPEPTPVAKPESLGDPFVDCPKAVDLPALPEAEAEQENASVPSPIALLPVHVSPEVPWKLSLLGGDLSERPRRRLVIEEIPGEPGKAGWTVSMQTVGNDNVEKTAVARLWRHENVLMFQWLQGAISTPMANQLRNCILAVGVRDREHNVALRHPVAIDSPIVDLLKPASVVFTIPWLPENGTAQLEILKVEGWEDVVLNPTTPLLPKTSGSIYSMRKDRQSREPVGAALQVNFSIRRSRVTVELKSVRPTAAVWRQLDPAGPKGSRLDDRVKQLTQEVAMAQGAQKSQLENALAIVDNQLWLRDFYRKVHRKAKLQFRVFVAVGDQQVELGRTP